MAAHPHLSEEREDEGGRKEGRARGRRGRAREERGGRGGRGRERER